MGDPTRVVVIRASEIRQNPPERRWIASEYCVVLNRWVRDRYAATEAEARHALATTKAPLGA